MSPCVTTTERRETRERDDMIADAPDTQTQKTFFFSLFLDNKQNIFYCQRRGGWTSNTRRDDKQRKRTKKKEEEKLPNDDRVKVII